MARLVFSPFLMPYLFYYLHPITMPPTICWYCNDSGSQASPSALPVHYTAVSRKLGKLQVDASLSLFNHFKLALSPHSPISSGSSRISPQPSPSSRAQHRKPIHTHPMSPKCGVQGVRFDIKSDHIYRLGIRLQAYRLGYALNKKVCSETAESPHIYGKQFTWTSGLNLNRRCTYALHLLRTYFALFLPYRSRSVEISPL